MSFSFAGVGTKEEVISQLGHAAITTGEERFNAFGAELRDLLVKHFGHESASAGPDHEYRYAVKAAGHGGGNSPLSVQLSVDPHWVAASPAPAAEPAPADPDPVPGADDGHDSAS